MRFEFDLKLPWKNYVGHYRANPEKYVEVKGHTEYRGSKNHKLLKKLEEKKDGKWGEVPSVAWVSDGDELCVYFLVVDYDGGIRGLSSPNGVPDGELMMNAEKAGVMVTDID